MEPHDFALEWMKDFEAYQKALNERGRDEHGEMAYSSSLMSSMCLVLEEFYNNLRVSQHGRSCLWSELMFRLLGSVP